MRSRRFPEQMTVPRAEHVQMVVGQARVCTIIVAKIRGLTMPQFTAMMVALADAQTGDTLHMP